MLYIQLKQVNPSYAVDQWNHLDDRLSNARRGRVVVIAGIHLYASLLTPAHPHARTHARMAPAHSSTTTLSRRLPHLSKHAPQLRC